MKVTEFHKLHDDVVRQVEYSKHLNAIFSAAECRTIEIGQTPSPGVVISDLGVQKTKTELRMTKVKVKTNNLCQNLL